MRQPVRCDGRKRNRSNVSLRRPEPKSTRAKLVSTNILFARKRVLQRLARAPKERNRVQKTFLRARDAPSRSPILRATLKNTGGRIASFPPPLSTVKRVRQFCGRRARKKHDATRPVKRRAVATGASFYIARAKRERKNEFFNRIKAHHRACLCVRFVGKMKESWDHVSADTKEGRFFGGGVF